MLILESLPRRGYVRLDWGDALDPMAMGAAGPALRGSAASAATAQHGGGRSIPVMVRRWQDYTGKKATTGRGRPHVRGNRGTASGPKCRTARRSRRRAGRTRGGRVLSAERIDPRAILAFGGIYSQAQLLAERAGKKAAHAMGLPTGGSHQFQKRRSTFTAQQRQNIGLLAAFAGWGRLLLLAGLLRRFGSLRPGLPPSVQPETIAFSSMESAPPCTLDLIV